MIWQFYLNDLEVDEPLGWSELELSMKRDDKLHGATFEAGLSTLRFMGEGAEYLESQYAANRISAVVIFSAFMACDGYDFEEVFRGRVNFGKRKVRCGDACTVDVLVEEESCHVTLRARYDQKVDLDSGTAFDGVTALASYAGLGREFELNAHVLPLSIDGEVAAGGSTFEFNESIPQGALHFWGLRPAYGRENMNSIDSGQLVPGSDFYWSFTEDGETTALIEGSPQLLFESFNGRCTTSPLEYSARMKGTLRVVTDNDDSTIGWLRYRVFTWGGEGFIWNDDDINVINEVTLQAGFPGIDTLYTKVFDETLSGTTTVPEGHGLYFLITFQTTGGDANMNIEVDWDPETNVLITTEKTCEATLTDGYLIHETLSRVVESITNNCMRVKSEYYGRTDSQPFDFPADGCGGVAMLTSGLKIRRAPNDKFFASLKELIEGLNGMDNIGMGTEPDPVIEGRLLLRIEGVEFFYQDTEIFRAPFIPGATEETIESEHYARILVGYNKWEVEGVNGLDEINSNREYSTPLDTINTTLDVRSNLVTGSYPIEVTRQQSFADTGAADTKYDNDIFFISLFRGGYLYSELMVEQGNITSASGMFSPDTLYNYHKSPIRNLIRWFRTIAAGLPDLNARLKFNSGTGNLQARGEQASGFCKVETMPLSESQNITTAHIADDFTPIWRPENITFEYPMALAEYLIIKANPYGYVSYQCGQGDWRKGWVREIKYRPVDGMATITLKKQYGN